VESATEMAM
jgi:hypothetical protein